MQEVFHEIWRIPVPLVGNPLKELGAYLVRSTNGGRHLLIDTGFQQEESQAALLGALEALGCALSQTDLFITHLHADHAGLMGVLKTADNRIYVSREDGEYLNAGAMGKMGRGAVDRAALMGFSSGDIAASGAMSIIQHRCNQVMDFTYVATGDVLTYGGYSLVVQDFKGHTPGQLGLYEATHKLLFSADHILAKITPNIIYWSDAFDALGAYLERLRHAMALDVETTFPGHRALILNTKERIQELLAHHKVRLEEVSAILKNGPQSVCQMAGQMEWSYGGGRYEEFPITQKWFAAGEAFSHLEHLRHKGQVKRAQVGQAYIYSVLP